MHSRRDERAPTAKFDCTCRRTKSSTRLRPTSLGRHGRAAALPRRARFRLAPLLVGSLWVIALFRELQNPLPVLAVGSVCVRAHRAAWPYPPRASGVRHHEHVATCYRSLVNESDMPVLTGVCTAEFSVGYNKEQHRQTCRNTRCTPSRRFRRDLAVPIRYSTTAQVPWVHVNSLRLWCCPG